AASQQAPEQPKESVKGESGASGVLDDTAITAKVKSKLAADVNLGTVVTIEVNTTEGVVTLAGKVNNSEQKQLAEDIARSVEGVVEVNNNLQLD
ncbi:MAG: BON domain-containing protein, partial [Desulforhabdus sp.]|nr:BON domain-containing protein [Desulforhabdus sp.]